jgi:ATP-dependent protease ClpP protease subunit
MSKDKIHNILFQASVSRPNIVFLMNAIEEKGLKDVLLMIHTAGGSNVEALHFFNYIKSRSINLTTYNLSFVGSAGVNLFLCGENRICSPFSSFMLHEGSFQINKPLKISEMKEYIERDEILKNIENNFLFQRGGEKCVESINKWSIKETQVSAQAAYDVGVCNKIELLSIPNDAILSKIQSSDFGENS